MGVLNGLKVLEFSHYIAGPFCTQLFADHGADVIKIEPINGEPARREITIAGERNFFFATFNRSKRSLALDLKKPEGLTIAKQLVSKADVLVTNYATGVPERLGIGYDSVSAINPGIIMVHITGFGLTGPYSDKIAFDSIVAGMSGLTDLTGYQDSPPIRTGLFVADHVGSLQAAIGVLMALYNRNITGKGQLVDIGMADGLVSMLAYNMALVKNLNFMPVRIGNRLRNTFSTCSLCKDGYVTIAPLNPVTWKAFCKIIGREEWAEDDSPYSTKDGRIENYERLEELIGEWTKQYSRREVLALLEAERIPCAPINTVKDVINDPHLQERGMMVSLNNPVCGEITVPGNAIKFKDTPGHPPYSPPELGEHTEEILKELGYLQHDIYKLKEKQVVKSIT